MSPPSTAAVEAVSGSLGAIIALLATYPLKTIYTLQAISATKSGTAGHAAIGVLDIIRRYKLTGLYAGIQPNIIETAVSSGVYFYIYSLLKKLAKQRVTASSAASSTQQLQPGPPEPPSSSSTVPLDPSHFDAVSGTSALSTSGVTGPATTSNNGGNGGGSAGSSTHGQTVAQPTPQPQTSVSDGSDASPRLGVLMSLGVAAAAGVFNQLLTMPIGTVATRIVANMKRRADAPAVAASLMLPGIPIGAWPVTRQIMAEGGLPGFWSGLIPALVLTSNPAIQYMLYEQILDALRRWKSRTTAQRSKVPGGGAGGDGASTSGTAAASAAAEGRVSLSAAEYFFASAAAKIGATVATFPLMVIKARLQAAGKSASDEQPYLGTLDVAWRILTHEGVGGFFSGLRAKILQTALNAALMMMLKEQLADGSRRVLDSGWRDVQHLARGLLT